ncbi:hypothetical protein DM860_004942 [Cuscuta australis]|uniref:Uncharacterized protein n=1 Tax=Cuscuta australis TaxID=267555 RepID=A0A328DRR1_9ASTE|nr:hypothetical protein DM860_004942 [Cuscuta australis]
MQNVSQNPKLPKQRNLRKIETFSANGYRPDSSLPKKRGSSKKRVASEIGRIKGRPLPRRESLCEILDTSIAALAFLFHHISLQFLSYRGCVLVGA